MKTFEAARAYRPRHGEGGSGSGSDAERHPPYQQWRAHPTLDPYKGVREARDPREDVESVPIAVLFDVTASMLHVPVELQARLPGLLPAVRRRVPHPQVLFGAIGDATCDRAPLQVGHFTSDQRRADDDLAHILLEGGGGGAQAESYELALYFLARHTVLDCRERHNKRGVAFLIGDEQPYPFVKGHEVAGLFGESLVKDIRLDTILREAAALWEVYFVVPDGATYAGDVEVMGFWRELLGDQVIELTDLSGVCELIARIVADRVMCANATCA
jgi:hypothetical protein